MNAGPVGRATVPLPGRVAVSEPPDPVAVAVPAGPVAAAAPDPAAGAVALPGRAVGAGLPQVTRGIGIAFGSTTVLSGFLYYFGWSRAYYFYDYFGVASSLLGLSAPDYLQLSVDGLFVPLTVVATITIAVLWARPWLGRLGRGRRRAAIARIALPAVGMLLLLNGMSAILVRTPLNRHLAVAPLCLAAGAALVVLSLRGARDGAPVGVAVAEWAAIVVLVGLSLFWVANDYSAAVGRSRAREMAAQLPSFPDTALYSEKSLSLRHPGVLETRCTAKDAGYPFRYDGLKLILRSGDQYLFLTTNWTPGNGLAVVMPRDGTRLEFTPTATSAPVTC